MHIFLQYNSNETPVFRQPVIDALTSSSADCNASYRQPYKCNWRQKPPKDIPDSHTKVQSTPDASSDGQTQTKEADFNKPSKINRCGKNDHLRL